MDSQNHSLALKNTGLPLLMFVEIEIERHVSPAHGTDKQLLFLCTPHSSIFFLLPLLLGKLTAHLNPPPGLKTSLPARL